jgi:hypothetical protein
MDPKNVPEHERKCASCYWFIPIFGGVRRCCCGVSPLCGNDETEQTCEHWSHERPSSRKITPQQEKADNSGEGAHENGESQAGSGNDFT